MKVVAATRSAQGSSASRRLRRANKVPGILFGGSVNPTSIELDHNPLYHSLRVEAFHSTVLDMELDGKAERVILRDVQWHAYKPQVLHVEGTMCPGGRSGLQRAGCWLTARRSKPTSQVGPRRRTGAQRTDRRRGFGHGQG